MEYIVHLLIIGCIASISAQAFNFAFGLGRLFTLAHVACYAVGAYTFALGSVWLSQTFDFELGFITALLTSGLVATLLAVPLAFIAARLRGDYFAIGTLAVAFLVSNAITNWRSLTNGVLGIPGILRAPLFGIQLDENLSFLLVTALVTIICHAGAWWLQRGPLGRRLMAAGEFPHAAAALGVSPFRTQGVAFVLSAFGAGIAGCLFAQYISFIDPSSFTMDEMIVVLTAVVVGRPGSIVGCIAASFGLLALGELMRFIPFAPGVLGPARQIVYAVLLLIVLYINRDSLFKESRSV